MQGRFSLAELEDAARLDEDVLMLLIALVVLMTSVPISGRFLRRPETSPEDGTELEHFESINRGAEGQLLSIEQVQKNFSIIAR